MSEQNPKSTIDIYYTKLIKLELNMTKDITRNIKLIEDLKQIFGEDLKVHLTPEPIPQANMVKTKKGNQQITEFNFKLSKN